MYGGYESREDGPFFFRASGGKTNPRDELLATLFDLLQPVEDFPENGHPQCHFPARKRFLFEALAIDPTTVAKPTCPNYHHYLADVKPSSATMIFASYYVGDPASLFGHTFMRLNRRNESSRLLDYGVNFGADIPETAGITAYLLRGLTGGFPGSYGIFPYYFRVQQYNNLESRDLYEYDLNLTDEQLAYLVDYLWELGEGISFDYYFLSENCSLQLLALLEAIDPTKDLTDRFPFWVIPINTIKVIDREPGLIAKRSVRPAIKTRFKTKYAGLNHRQEAVYRQIADHLSFPLPEFFSAMSDQDQAAIVDTLLDLLYYKLVTLEKTDDLGLKRFEFELLKLRSTMSVPPFDPPPALGDPPESGHESTRLRLGIGAGSDGVFSELIFAPSFHHLLDPAPGYPAHTTMQVLTLATRHSDDRPFTLERFTLLNLLAFNPDHSLRSLPSWMISVDYEPVLTFAPYGRHHYSLTGGIGLSYGLGRTNATLLYLMSDLRLGFASHYEYFTDLVPGIDCGAIVVPIKLFRLRISLRYRYSRQLDPAEEAFGSLETRFQLGGNLDLFLDSRVSVKKEGTLLGGVSWFF